MVVTTSPLTNWGAWHRGSRKLPGLRLNANYQVRRSGKVSLSEKFWRDRRKVTLEPQGLRSDVGICPRSSYPYAERHFTGAFSMSRMVCVGPLRHIRPLVGRSDRSRQTTHRGLGLRYWADRHARQDQQAGYETWVHFFPI